MSHRKVKSRASRRRGKVKSTGNSGTSASLAKVKRVTTLSASEAKALELSSPQQTAMEKMLSGDSLSAAASAAGVTRMTLYRWLNHDPRFQAAYNAWQQEALLGARTKLLALADSAVSTVAHEVQHNGRLALRVLESLGVLEPPVPGSTDPKEVEQRMKLDRRKSEAKLQDEMIFASLTGGAARVPTAKELMVDVNKIE